jgi:hypothetical protein
VAPLARPGRRQRASIEGRGQPKEMMRAGPVGFLMYFLDALLQSSALVTARADCGSFPRCTARLSARIPCGS